MQEEHTAVKKTHTFAHSDGFALPPGGGMFVIWELTADVGEAAAAVGAGGDRRLVASAGGNVRLAEVGIAL